MNKLESYPTIGLVHGAFHGTWCWEPLRNELEGYGYKTVAMDLPTEDPEATFEDYAGTVVDALKSEDKVVLVGHSRAGNVIPRAAGSLATQKLIFLCAGFETETIAPLLREDDEDQVPPRRTKEYESALKGKTRLDPEAAKSLFFDDCPPDIQEWAVQQLRTQYPPRSGTAFEAWPSVPSEFIMCTQDRVIRPEWSEYAARLLGVEPIKLPGGHSPFLSRPQELAKKLIELL